MLKYSILILLILCGTFFYLNYPESSKDISSIKIGEVFYIRVVGRDDLEGFFKRISTTQVLFSFIKDGEQPQVDSNPEAAYNLGGEILVLGGVCRIRFDNMETSYKGRINCETLNELKFRAFLQATKVGDEAFQIAEDVLGQTGEVLAKIEGLSDKILNKTLEVNDSERMIAMFKDGVPKLYQDNSTSQKPSVGVKPRARRSSFLSASNEGQEIYLASRLLDEEAKVLLKLQKYSAKGADLIAENAEVVEVPISPESNVIPEKANTNSKPEGEWWKDLD